jgi:hypothetical protein
MAMSSRSLVVNACLPFAAALAFVGCNSGGGGGGTPVLAAATIGPAGGEIAVTSGVQAGLRLTIPPGALAAPVEVRIVDLRSQPMPGVQATTMVPPVGFAFGIEPAGLQLAEQATLRAPFVVVNVQQTAPGNVRAREYRAGGTLDWEPAIVDIGTGVVEVPIRFLNRYQVVRGPVAPLGIIDYWQPIGAPVTLAGGWSFVVEDVPAGAPLAGPSATRWRITSTNGISQFVEDLYFAFQELRGRGVDQSLETWALSYPAWTPLWNVPPPTSLTMPTQVVPAPSAPTESGQITVFSTWSWQPPRTIAGRQLLDLVELRVTLAWNRPDFGFGQREYRFLFGAGVGLVALSQDGIEHARTSW